MVLSLLAPILGAANTMTNYTTAASVFLGSIIVLYLFKFFVIRKLGELAKKTENEWDDAVIEGINRIRWPILVLVSIYLGALQLTLPEIITSVLVYLLVISTAYYAVQAIFGLIDVAIKDVRKLRKEKEGGSGIIDFLAMLLKGILVGMALIWVLSNFGFNVTSLIAGLGIGGIAIAFALQNILIDIFASFSIYFDKPFVVGDYILVGNDSGIVNKIGIKTTRLRTLQGQELIISNRELTETRVNNFKKMKKRRISFSLGVIYGTPVSKLEKIPKTITKIIDGIELAELDRVHFAEFADSSMNFDIVYYVNTPEYQIFRDIQQEINLKLVKAFEKDGIEFAFPTRTVHLAK